MSEGEQGRRREKERRGEGWGWERKQHSIAKRPTDTKGRRMTGTRVKPARRNEEEGDGKRWIERRWEEGGGERRVGRRLKPTVELCR